MEVGRENSLFIHVTLVPFLRGSDEHKSKPTQHSVKELQGMGINPNIVVLRCDEPLEDSIFKKISLFCNVKPDCVIENITLPNLYEAPLMLEKADFSSVVCRELGIDSPMPDLEEWTQMVDNIKSRQTTVRIGLVGKYVGLHDAYLSVAEALRHAGYENKAFVEIKWVDTELITEYTVNDLLGDVDGILVPGGFGQRGVEGKIKAAEYARKNNIPYLGICLGMQVAVMEFARNVLGFEDANSGEFAPESKHKVIDIMEEQMGVVTKGGTMRLGAYPCKVKPGSMLDKCYGKPEVAERHRHRYEFNNEFRDAFEKAGMVISGTSPNGLLVEAVEIPANKFFVAVQYHPEFKSRPTNAHPVFREFIKASLGE